MSFSRVPIRSVATISSGKRPPEVSKEKTEELTIPVIGGGGPSGFTSKTLAEKGVLITGRVGTLGKLHVAAEDCWPSDNALILRPSSESFDNQFLRYALSEVIGDAVGLNRGAANPLLTQTDLGQLKIAAPNFNEQREIAATLGALDDKIQLNRKTAATLEEMARALYRSWFVDFDPVHAKVAGRAPVHMDSQTAALFPDSFGEDGLPEGWMTSSLGDLSKISSGKRPPTKSTMPDAQNQMPVYGGNGISWYTRDALFDERFLITGRVGTLGTVFRVSEPCWVSDNALCVFPISIPLLEFLFFAVSDLDFASLNSGSTQPLLTQTSLKKQPVARPPDAIISEFHTLVGDWFRKVQLLDKENQTLADLRDTLLPRLMSGELRVGEAQKQVEAVA